jgi:hypothetical protein
MSAGVYLTLVHHPVRDRFGETVTTAVTNLDVHDLSRSARTYGLRAYFIVTPIEAQRILVDRILEHWRTGPGRERVPERADALGLCRSVESIEQVISNIADSEGHAPWVVATAARSSLGIAPLSFADVRATMSLAERPTLIVLGTGHGLADTVLQSADALLAPIRGPTDYNHLSVRAAGAIILDRLLGHHV